MLNIRREEIEVLSINGNAHLGGQDFDNKLMKHCIDKFKEEHKIDLGKNDRAKAKIRKACNDAKH